MCSDTYDKYRSNFVYLERSVRWRKMAVTHMFLEVVVEKDDCRRGSYVKRNEL